MGLLARGVSAPFVHEEMLLVVALVLAAICVVGGLLLLRHAGRVGERCRVPRFCDMLVLVGLFLVSGRQAKRREAIRLGDEERAQL